MSGWTALVLAGLFEVGFTSSLKLSENFTRGRYVALFFVAITCSFTLAKTLRDRHEADLSEARLGRAARSHAANE